MHKTIAHYHHEQPAGNAASDAPKLRHVEAMIDDMKHLLKRNNGAFDDEVIHRQIDLLEHWMNCYRNDLVAADTYSDASTALISDLRSRLKLAAEELQRFAGSNPPAGEQAGKIKEIAEAVRRSEKLLTNMEALFPVGNH